MKSVLSRFSMLTLTFVAPMATACAGAGGAGSAALSPTSPSPTRITSIDVASLAFHVVDATVKVSTSTTLRHGSQVLQFLDLKVGDQVEVRGTRTGATIAATEIKVESETDEGNDESTSDK